MRFGSTRQRAALASALPVVLAACVYYPITKVYFFADDFIDLASIRNDGFLRFVTRPFGGHNYLTRNLVFYGSAHLFGMHAEPYFWTVLLTHLLNVWLLFRVLRTVTSSLVLASFGATLWGTSPVLVGTLGWYSVYGQVLAATVLLGVLDRVAVCARSGAAPSARTIATWYVLLLLGSACFGVGIGVAVAFPAVLFLLVPAAWRRRGARLAVLTLPVATVAFYLGCRRLHALLEPLSFDEIIAGGITLERLLAAPRALPALLAVSVNASLRSFFFSPTASNPVAFQATIALFGVGVGILLWQGDAATRRTALAMVALCLCVYAVVAVGRQIFGPPWQLAVQPRYHYVGSLPIVILACLVLAEVGRLDPHGAVPRIPLLLAALALGAYGWARSDFRVDEHDVSRQYLAGVLRGISSEVAARPAGTTVLLDNGKPSAALLGPVLVGAQRLFAGRAAAFLLAHEGDELDGRRVRFVERDAAVTDWYLR